MNAAAPVGRRPFEPEDGGRQRTRDAVALVALVVAATAHAAAGVAVAISGLVAPDWARWVFVAVWLVGLERLAAWRRDPLRSLAVPVAMWTVLIVAVVVGDAWLGWTA